MKDKEIETVYCIAYALTQGIFTVEGSEKENGRFMCPDRHYQSFAKSGWTRCPKEAIQMAEKLRKKKIASLHKQIERVQKMELKVPE